MSQRSLLLFEQAIKTEATLKAYKYQLEKFRSWAKVKNYNGLLEASRKEIQELLEDYVMYLKKNLSPNSIPIYFSPIELFYVMNDIDLNFKKIRKLFPEKVKKGNERGYTHEEIKTIISHSTSKRNISFVLLLASSGCRLGAIPGLKIRHLKRIEESYSIKIYDGDKEEDYIFTTPEATKAIDSYLDERKKDGEYFDQDTPIFRTYYRLGIEKVKPCATTHLTEITQRMIRMIERKRTGKTKRFDVPKNHGFRKFFATVIKNTEGVTPTMTEKLINHIGIVQLDGSYFKPTVEKMYEAYKKSIPELTIDQTEKHNATLKAITKEKQELEKTLEEKSTLEETVANQQNQLNEIKEFLAEDREKRINKYNKSLEKNIRSDVS